MNLRDLLADRIALAMEEVEVMRETLRILMLRDEPAELPAPQAEPESLPSELLASTVQIEPSEPDAPFANLQIPVSLSAATTATA